MSSFDCITCRMYLKCFRCQKSNNTNSLQARGCKFNKDDTFFLLSLPREFRFGLKLIPPNKEIVDRGEFEREARKHAHNFNVKESDYAHLVVDRFAVDYCPDQKWARKAVVADFEDDPVDEGGADDADEAASADEDASNADEGVDDASEHASDDGDEGVDDTDDLAAKYKALQDEHQLLQKKYDALLTKLKWASSILCDV